MTETFFSAQDTGREWSDQMGFLDELKKMIPLIGNQTETGKKAGVSQPTMSRIVNGDIGSVTVKNIAPLLDMFGFRLLAPGEKAETKDLKSEIDRINVDVFSILAKRGVTTEIITEVQRAIMNIEAVEQPSHRQAAGE